MGIAEPVEEGIEKWRGEAVGVGIPDGHSGVEEDDVDGGQGAEAIEEIEAGGRGFGKCGSSAVVKGYLEQGVGSHAGRRLLRAAGTERCDHGIGKWERRVAHRK